MDGGFGKDVHASRDNASFTTSSHDGSPHNSQKQYLDEKVNRSETAGSAINDKGALGGPSKTYDFVAESVKTKQPYEIQHNGRPVLWIRNKRSLWKAPQIHIHSDSDHGEIVAACRLSLTTRNLPFMLGNPDGVDKDSWPVAKVEGYTSKAYNFEASGQGFRWERTHREDLGSSRMSNKDYELVKNGGETLAVFLFTHKPLPDQPNLIGRLNWFRSTGREVELLALAVLLGIEESNRLYESAAIMGGVSSGAAAATAT
ncbi:hypothetical protein LTR10_009639 [Elasticomyces elasticus]|nr:hypothetical protein LTR10_009639 [Elasticomyces elasticus]KAK4969931.1 hypothetical protein LTR42_008097 [Elasticomyces elasticus]